MWVFAHRGESAIYPENSRDAIAACDSSEMDGIEVDLYQAGDRFVVFHDRWMMRVLGLQKKITDLTPEELERIVGRDDKPLPDLAWLLKTTKDKELTLNIELKNIQDVALFHKQLSQLILELSFDVSRLLISAFDHTYLLQLSNLEPKLKLGLLTSSIPLDVAYLIPNFEIYSVHLDMNCISADLIQKLKKRGVKVFVFTVDQESEIDWLLNQQVDAIFANDPRQAYKIINNLL